MTKIDVAKINEIIHRMFEEATEGVEHVAEGQDLATIRGEVGALQDFARELNSELRREHARESGNEFDLGFNSGIDIPEIDSAKLHGRYEEDKALNRAYEAGLNAPHMEAEEWYRENA